MKVTLISVMVFICTATVLAQKPERTVHAEILVNSKIENVWKAWTTEAGVKSFFAPGCNVSAQVGGQYEIYFNPTGEPGKRGAEGTKILALEPNRMLAFTWNNPPHIAPLRWQYTSVVVKLKPAGANRTRVSLSQTGWGDTKDWDQAFAYFSKAWREQVLPYLKYSLEVGPVDWKTPPQLANQFKPSAKD
jgi:uncharacterized protein YndB with AHSA1/START domain